MVIIHSQYPDSYSITCVAASDLKSTSAQIKAHPVPVASSPTEFQEIFLNFHFSCTINIVSHLIKKNCHYQISSLFSVQMEVCISMLVYLYKYSLNSWQKKVASFLFSATAKVPFTTAVNGHVFVPPTSPPQVRKETHRQTYGQTDGNTYVLVLFFFKR